MKDEDKLKQITKGSKNIKQLKSFTAYCLSHKDERFWQALRNWSGNSFIYVSEHSIKDLIGSDKSYFLKDTFFIE